MSAETTILQVRDLGVSFGFGAAETRAVDGVSFRVERGETVALVGESGSGKSISALALTRLTPRAARYVSGEALFAGRDLLKLSEAELRRVRGGRIAYVFQEPMTSFNPVFTVGWQIAEAIRLHRGGLPAEDEVARLLNRVRLPERLTRAYPHQMSGGQLQRCMIAMALACSPDLLVADEPTTALDVTVQREILDLLSDVRDESGLSVLLITHNFGVVAETADRTYVMRKGRIVEEGPTRRVLDDPHHPYTQALMAAVPRLKKRGAER